MSTLGREDAASPTRRRRQGGRKSFARRMEQTCCTMLSYFPLSFVYGVTTWACWIGVSIGLPPRRAHWSGPLTSVLVFSLYVLANASYTVAVFTDPGSPRSSPSSSDGAYSSLPTAEPGAALRYTSLSIKASGRPRYCTKCRCVKPDRTHHCSTCRRCVLKMDHHCPWLSTCVGMRNYKGFLLFVVYTSLYCWACLFVTAQWMYFAMLHVNSMEESVMTVNIIVLSVVSGVIGIVLSGFAGWHVYLAASGQTTFECLEKTRYLNPMKKSMEQQLRRSEAQRANGDDESHEPLLDQLKEIHANALPGVLRPEEGEERDSNVSLPSTNGRNSPATDSLRRSYREMEQQRERDRYLAYLDELDSEKMPNPFNLGWRRNLHDLFGPNPWLWFVPVCNTVGDGWTWDVSESWLQKRNQVALERVERHRTAEQSWGNGAADGYAMRSGPRTAGAGRHYAEQPNRGETPLQHLSRTGEPSGRAEGHDSDELVQGNGGADQAQGGGRRKGD